MKITCLVENTLGRDKCQAEHGLSLLVEMGEKCFLADTGASDLFLRNAECLGVDITKVEAVFVSHGHYDHAGGIMAFSNINPNAPIILQRKAFGDFWHKSVEVERYIGVDQEIRNLREVKLMDGDYDYSADISVFVGDFKEKDKLLFWPKGNLDLKEKQKEEFVQDDFSHEQYMVFKENGKEVLISGCAHNGILNILEAYRKKYNKEPDIIISGFHMRKKAGYTKEDINVIEETAKCLKETDCLCYTGHCTGEEPYEIMKGIMGEQLQYIHCGDVIEL